MSEAVTPPLDTRRKGIAFARWIGFMGWAVSVLIAAAIPALYYNFAVRAERLSLEIETDYVATAIQSIIFARPEMWEFETVRLLEIASKRTVDDHEDERTIYSSGNIVIETKHKAPAPVITSTAPIFVSGEKVGSVRAKRSVRNVMWQTIFAAILGSAFGLVVFLLFRSYPLRMLNDALNALASEKGKYETTLSSIGDGVITVDLEGRIVYMNPVAETCTGWRSDEALGRNLKDCYVTRREDEREEIEGHTTCTLLSRNGDPRTIEEVWSPIKGGDSAGEGHVIVFRDVEEKRKLERQMQQAHKMEAVGTLAGGIAHDFNNSLTGIVGFGELLRMRMAGDGEALHDLDEIQRCAERASTLTRQLLTFARRQITEPVNLDMNTLVADLMKLIGKVVGEYIEVKTSLAEDLPTIHADRGQVEQVVMNLCLNARDAMPEGGRLVVETVDAVLDEEYVRRNPYMKAGRYVLLTVSDTGVGMDEKTRKRVFEPFFTTKGPDKGTGLGLAMVYGIVKQHGGFIHVYSEPGKGTAFKAYFPAIEAQPDAVPTIRREEIVRGGTETILLAEDEEIIRAFIERALRTFGYIVLVARNGEEAIEISERNKEIDLAVLDMVMPRKGGKEAFEEMHRRNPRLKVIFMSGYSADAMHDSFVLAPGTPFLQKPFGPTILARKVREVLDTQ